MTLDAVTSRQKTKIQAKRKRLAEKQRFRKAQLAEKSFARRLRQVAKQVGDIVKGFSTRELEEDPSRLNILLHKYAETLKPWAEAVAKSTVAEVAQRDTRAWSALGKEIGQNLRAEILNAPTGQLMREMVSQRVELITSLPTKAAERVHKLVIEGMSNSSRASEISKEIQRTGKVTRSRADLIAITETSSANSLFVEARSRHVGSEGYIWRTTGDVDVREEHQEHDGKFFYWDKPPVSGPNGQRYHAGRGPRCRCWPDPVIPD